MSFQPLDSAKVRAAGMDVERVERHQKRIVQALRKEVETTIPVVDACTVENGGVMPWHRVLETLGRIYNELGEGFSEAAARHWQGNRLVSCIPAAGAASRFLKDLHKFVGEAEAGLQEGLEGAAAKVKLGEEFKKLAASISAQRFDKVKNKALEVESRLYGDEALATKLGRPETQRKAPTLDRALLNRSWKVEMDSSRPREDMAARIEALRKKWSREVVAFAQAFAAAKAFLEIYGDSAKASVETTLEGDTFLDLKIVEQLCLLPCAETVLIVPAGKVGEYQEEVRDRHKRMAVELNNPFVLEGTPSAPQWMSTRATRGRWQVFEQGRELSTLRFDMDGSPLLDEKGDYSGVSAGHGELVHVFDKLVDEFSQSDCLHIRNIDNIIGAKVEQARELMHLSEVFRHLRNSLEALRKHVEEATTKNVTSLNHPDALRACERLEEWARLAPSHRKSLTASEVSRVLQTLFGASHFGENANWQNVLKRLCMPLSVFGVVKKLQNDVGGGPVMARMPGGEVVKLCMEMPHASESDSKAFFASGGKSTHFNPVLVFVEMRTHNSAFFGQNAAGKAVSFGQLFDERFWLLIKREFQGRPVCYHETVLYELLGNSARTNLVFVEVPRSLFTPHKAIFDSLGKSRKSYGFGESLKSED